MVRQVPVTTLRYVPERRVESVPVRVQKWVTESRTQEVRRKVSRWVPSEVVQTVPKTVVMRVPVGQPATTIYSEPTYGTPRMTIEPPLRGDQPVTANRIGGNEPPKIDTDFDAPRPPVSAIK